MKPNFLVIGAMKCATTSLCELLAQHPDVFITDPKEPEFFCKDFIYQRTWSWYQTRYDDVTTEKAIGEGSVSNTKVLAFPNAAPRIARHVPDAKLIYIVRHPLERLESHWMNNVRNDATTPRDFGEALKTFPHMIDTSLYWKQISQYRQYFDDQQILILFYDDFKHYTQSVMQQCFAFLEVDPNFEPAEADKPRNPSLGHQVDSDWLIQFRQSWAYRMARRICSAEYRSRWAQRFKFQLDHRPKWNADLWRWAVDQIQEDSQAFLKHTGRASDYWNFEFAGDRPATHRHRGLVSAGFSSSAG